MYCNEKVIIILPVHNRIKVTEKVIDCLAKQTLQDYYLLVVDDGSTDGTSEYIRSQISKCEVLKGDGNLWWAGALQEAYRWLNKLPVNPSTTVLILNDDVIFDADFLEKGVSILDAKPDALILPYDYDVDTGELIDCGVHLDWKFLRFTLASDIEDINILSTRGLFLKKGTFKKVGGFHRYLIPHYLSDYEFTYRAYKKGMRLIATDQIRVYEDTSQTGIRNYKPDSVIGFIRNYFSKKSGDYFLAWFSFIILRCPWKYKLFNLIRTSIVLGTIRFAFRKRVARHRVRYMERQLTPAPVTEIRANKRETARRCYGYVEHSQIVEINGHRILQVSGWAISPQCRFLGASKVYVFHGNRCIACVKPGGISNFRFDVSLHKKCSVGTGWIAYLRDSNLNVSDLSFFVGGHFTRDLFPLTKLTDRSNIPDEYPEAHTQEI